MKKRYVLTSAPADDTPAGYQEEYKIVDTQTGREVFYGYNKTEARKKVRELNKEKPLPEK